MAKLPDPSKRQVVLEDPTNIKANVEKSGKEMHDAFVSRINELRAKRKEEEKMKELAQQQESFLKSLTGKKTVLSSAVDE